MASRHSISNYPQTRELESPPFSSLSSNIFSPTVTNSKGSVLESLTSRKKRVAFFKGLRVAFRSRNITVPISTIIAIILVFGLFVFCLTVTFFPYKSYRDPEFNPSSVKAASFPNLFDVSNISQKASILQGADLLKTSDQNSLRIDDIRIGNLIEGNGVPGSISTVLGGPRKSYSFNTLEEALRHKAVSNNADNPTDTHMHGRIGIGIDKKPLWSPKPLSGFRMSNEQKVEAHTGYCFNTKVSESLALDRPVPDYNSHACRSVEYPEDLPPASVIIVFHNENLSVLLRSFHSVLNHTPPQLLKEVILVDDCSNSTTHPWLFNQLDEYLQYVPKVVVRRLKERHGLMRARMAGVEWSSGSILIFLDSHIECTNRWIEPLIAACHRNRKNIVVPLIHTIDFDSFAFESSYLDVLGFSWSLGQTHPHQESSSFEPMRSPIMAGGLFATDKSWFLELGGYDSEMRLYGGEEVELGFKTWMCGGELYALPCSRVGHVFRSGQYWKHQVYKVPGEEIHRNKLRTAEVWMDEYAKIAKLAIPQLPPNLVLGPLDEAKAVRERLQCKSFQWYLDTIYPSLKVPKIIGGKAGAIRNIESNACLDSLLLESAGSRVGAYPCHGQHGTQAFLHDAEGSIYLVPNDFKFCVRSGKDGILGWGADSTHVTATADCKDHTWIYDEKNKLLKVGNTITEPTPKCLKVVKQKTSLSPFDLLVADCDPELGSQKFEYDIIE